MSSTRPDQRPSFQFYPSDWTGETSLKLCSLSARGLWIEMMCLAFKSPVRGVILQPNGSRMEAEDIAALVGRPEAEVKQALSELEARGVFSTDENGAPYSRRMVRDEKQRQSKVEAGRIGGAKSRPGSKPEAKRGSSSSASSSSSSSSASSPTPTSSSIEKEKKTVPSTADEPPTVVAPQITDEERTQPYREWLREASKEIEPVIVSVFDRELMAALELYYERRGGRMTPTRVGDVGKSLQRAKTVEHGMLALEVFIDNHAGDKDHKYLQGIIRRMSKITESQFDAEHKRHRDRHNGSGVWRTANSEWNASKKVGNI